MIKIFLFILFNVTLVFSQENAITEEANDALLDLELDELLDIRLKLGPPHNIHHIHEAGEFMFSYRHGTMSMDGMRDGTSNYSMMDVHDAGYMVAPLSMDMTMEMFGIMYSPSDKLTLMAMMNWTEKTMDLNRRMMMMDTPFRTESSGLGDLKFEALYALQKNDNTQFIISFGLSLPTGEINNRDDTPMANNTLLPYGMQLGSGTVDPKLALTYIKTLEAYSYGAHVESVFRLYDNYREYHLGNEYKMTLWSTYFLNDSLALVGRFDFKKWDNISGEDSELKMMSGMNPNADPDLLGGFEITTGLGLTYLKGNWQLNAGFDTPLYEDFDGIQMKTKIKYSFGISYIF